MKAWALLLIAVCSPALGCSIDHMQSDSERIQVCTHGVCKTVRLDQLVSQSRKEQEVEIWETFQRFLDVRTPLDELPLDDPVRGWDPNCHWINQPGNARYLWGDEDGYVVPPTMATHYIDRECFMDRVEWYRPHGRFIIGLRRPPDC